MWKITPLNFGVLTVTKSGLTYGCGVGEKMEVPCIGWLLTNNKGTKILVDQGHAMIHSGEQNIITL